MAEHHPQVAAAHVLDGNRHLEDDQPRGYMWKIAGREEEGWRGLTFTVSFQQGCFTW